MRKFLACLFMASFLFSCKKETKTSDQLPPVFQDHIVKAATGGGPNCNSYSPLDPQPDGSYTGFVNTTHVRVTAIAFQAFDQNGYPITPQTGDPFLGTMDITDNSSAEILYNSSSPQNDQIVVRFNTPGLTTLNAAGYISALNTYLASHPNVFTGIPSFLYGSGIPDISTFITSGQSSHYDTAVRLIRLNPAVVAYIDANGHPVMTSFALAPSCFPRPGTRAGSPNGGTTIKLQNIMQQSLHPPSPVKVELIQNGSVKLTANFPATGSGSALPITPGSYILRMTVPSGFQNFYLNYTLFHSTIQDGYWEGGSGSTIVTTNALNLASGTAYTISAATIPQ